MSLEKSDFDKGVAKILAVGTAVPSNKMTQAEIANLLNIKTEKSMRFFSNPHIETRYLCSFDQAAEKNNSDLLIKFKKNAVALSSEAALKALTQAQLKVQDVDFICCVTSTGYIVPSLSNLLIENLGLRSDCEKLDLVGMGCSAGLNGISSAANWCRVHPSKKALVICCEISSAIYCLDDNENTALVNSLFGDGVAAAIIECNPKSGLQTQLLKFSTLTAAHTLDLLRFDWNDLQNRYQFYVGKETPEVLGKNVQQAVNNLLKDGPSQNQIKHWILHSGGTAILDKIESSLQLKPQDLRHTRSVLKNYGNISSGSFLFSLKEFMLENKIAQGDYGVMMTMGPGLTIEMGLVQW